jgi:hypothetical protein
MHYLYETPWWLPTLIAVLGVILFMSGASSADKRLRLAGVCIIAVAILLVALSWFLKSDREIVENRTRAMLATVEKRDWPAFRRYLHPKIAVVGRLRGPDEVSAALQGAAGFFDLQSLRVSALDAIVEADTIQVSLQVVAHGRGGPQPTGWQLEWRKNADGQWTLFDVEARDAPGFNASWVRDRPFNFR